MNIFRHQWKLSGAARTRTHASDGGARRQRQGGGAGGGGEAFSIYLITKKQLGYLLRLEPEMYNPQRFKTVLWERLSGEADGKALPHN
jgi:hypothetical protein